MICSQGSQQKDMWLNKPAMLIQHQMSKKPMPQEDNKKSKSVCSDKKCQDTKSYKKIDKNSQTCVIM